MKDKINKILNLDFDKKIIEWFKFFLILSSMYIIPSIIYSAIDYFKIIKSENIMNLIALVFYLIFLVAIYYKSIKAEFILFKKNSKKNVNEGFKCWTIGLTFMMISNLIINMLIFDGNISANEELVRKTISGFPIISIINAVLIAPFIEEIIFRKSIKNVVKNKTLYIIISGVFFGLAHALTNIDSTLNLLYILPYGALGAAFAYSYIKTKSIFTSVLIHIWHNAFTIFLLIISNNIL